MRIRCYSPGCGEAGDLLDGAEDAGGEGEEGGDELEDTADNDADEAKGKKDQPDERVEDQREESRGPADDEEDQEEEKLHGVWLPFFGLYAGGGVVVPWLGGFGFAGESFVEKHLQVGLVLEAALFC